VQVGEVKLEVTHSAQSRVLFSGPSGIITWSRC